jgi:hypothetical protein
MISKSYLADPMNMIKLEPSFNNIQPDLKKDRDWHLQYRP